MAQKKHLIALTLPELDHVLGVLYEAQRDGSYYGNKEQYHARLDRIIRELEGVLNGAV
jgi:hypothetical protein